MSYYDNLTMGQVNSFYTLIKLLRRLRVIGVLYAETRQATQEIDILGVYDIIDMTDAIYRINKLGYSEDKNHMRAEEYLEKIYGRINQSLRGCP